MTCRYCSAGWRLTGPPDCEPVTYQDNENGTAVETRLVLEGADLETAAVFWVSGHTVCVTGFPLTRCGLSGDASGTV